MRYAAYRHMPHFGFDRPFAATVRDEMITPLIETNDKQAAIFAAVLWAHWMGQTVWLYDSTLKKYIGSYGPTAKVAAQVPMQVYATRGEITPSGGISTR